ncbi:cytochrome P450 [Hygrophoropsis aurantiaca]|uniref:Cytochrome P450 n=1 Tax=Hygrophoropsis aurantiaca TaxID=72124 RepID=A0ACB8AJE7_9AGAM|nr:cytochrome P450 [Hygrophoropsis aurantiaca]
MSYTTGTKVVCALLVVGLTAKIITRARARKGKEPYPPGPPPLPLLGNVLDINVDHPWLTYTEWSATYGDLIFTQILNQHIVVIGSEHVAKALLDKRSQIYSGRPLGLVPINELFGVGFSSIFMPYNDLWRLHRRLFHQAFRADAAPSFRPIQMRKSHQLLLNILSTPDNFAAHLQTLSTSIIMAIVYDYETAASDDPIVETVKRALELVIEEIRPEVTAILSLFPILKHIPAWFPGARFKRKALLSRKYASEWKETPFQYVKSQMALENAAPSMVSDALRKIEGKDESGHMERAIKESAASSFAAASETTFSVLMVFALAMVLNPDVQAKAQAEIDSAVGFDRLPDWDDRPLLPYVDAIIRETLRWHPVVPLGIPHAAVDDDIYEGQFIPKGATVMANAWAMSQNPEKYPNPSEFNPERFFLPSGELNDDLVGFAFGFGRRVCVGRHVADASLWAAIVNMLAVFSFQKLRDEEGKVVEFEPKWSAGVTTHPEPFPCMIVPRSKTLDVTKLTEFIQAIDVID